MTEAEWLTGDDPLAMLGHLCRPRWRALGLRRHKPSERKLRLLLVAIFQRRRPAPSRWSAQEEAICGRWEDAMNAAEQAADGLPLDDKFSGWIFAPRDVHSAVLGAFNREPPEGVGALYRDIFGNPFRPVSFLPEWRTSTVTALAFQMYESRDFSAMPILADALQDTGCDSTDVLDQCRGPGPHVRGCWVVDLVLGKG